MQENLNDALKHQKPTRNSQDRHHDRGDEMDDGGMLEEEEEMDELLTCCSSLRR